jgi:transcription elongation factor GreA
VTYPHAGVHGFRDEVDAVEQDNLASVGRVAACRGAIPRDQRIVPAGNRLERQLLSLAGPPLASHARAAALACIQNRPSPGKLRITLWYYRLAMAESMKDRLIKKFEDEIQTLNYELKLELPKEIRRARELGDLRENAEYAAAKERQRLVEARISMLQKRVSEIALINIDRIPKDRAGFGSTVHVIEGNGEKLVFQLVMPEDADAAKGLISTTSPIGRAFLNKEQGDNVHVTTPGGTREFEIVKLLTIHDEAE